MEKIMNDALLFIQKCDEDFENNVFLPENSVIATRHIALLKQVQLHNDSLIVDATIKKLEFIRNQMDAAYYHTYNMDNIINLVSVSVTDYIIQLVKKKHLVDPILIARYAYIELAKVLYYDISYVKQQEVTTKNKICDAPVNVEKEKIFSYVVCTQWLQLYSYILAQFGMNVIPRKIPNQNHVWGEIPLNNQSIIVVDATDYINSSIDFSNAKSMSPTVGFVVLPKQYSNMKLYDIFHDKSKRAIAATVQECYKKNRDFDIALHYITSKGYPAEKIIRENELFHHSKEIITNPQDAIRYLTAVKEFFKNLKIPNNIDGYEIFAYYNLFLKQLPMNIRTNIAADTIYVDSFDYKLSRIRKKFLQFPNDYLRYLQDLIFNRFYKYLPESETDVLVAGMRKDDTGGKTLSSKIAESELCIAKINREINLYYAINKLQFFEPETCETLGIQLYEPLMGVKRFTTLEDYHEFQKTMSLK